jgi:DUF4097 and DUF4098 domain-containing protein YvlB
MMKNISMLWLFFSLLFLGSCFYIRVEYPPETMRTPMEEFHENVPLPPGSTLSLENGSGNIEIHGWEKEELEVYAEKMIQFPDKTKLYVFPRRDFGPGIVFDKFENYVKIRTKNVNEEKAAGYVDYFIDAPHSINLKDIVLGKGNIHISELYGDAYVDLMEGEITVENFSGSLTASTVQGSVYASLFDLREQDEVVITTKEGNITLTLQENASAHLVAAFPEGEISSEFDLEIIPEDNQVDIQWGEKRPLISLTALRGNITIKKTSRD